MMGCMSMQTYWGLLLRLIKETLSPPDHRRVRAHERDDVLLDLLAKKQKTSGNTYKDTKLLPKHSPNISAVPPPEQQYFNTSHPVMSLTICHSFRAGHCGPNCNLLPGFITKSSRCWILIPTIFNGLLKTFFTRYEIVLSLTLLSSH